MRRFNPQCGAVASGKIERRPRFINKNRFARAPRNRLDAQRTCPAKRIEHNGIIDQTAAIEHVENRKADLIRCRADIVPFRRLQNASAIFPARNPHFLKNPLSCSFITPRLISRTEPRGRLPKWNGP